MQTEQEQEAPQPSGPPTDPQIVERMSKQQLAQVTGEPQIRGTSHPSSAAGQVLWLHPVIYMQLSQDSQVAEMDLTLQRLKEKLQEVDDRIEDLEGRPTVCTKLYYMSAFVLSGGVFQ